MLGVDIEVIVEDGERLRTFGYAGHKLLHLKEDAGLLTDFKLLHGNVGGGNAIYMQKQGEGEQINTLISAAFIAHSEQVQRPYLSSRGLHCQW